MLRPDGVESGSELESAPGPDIFPSDTAPHPLDRSGRPGQAATHPLGSG